MNSPSHRKREQNVAAARKRRRQYRRTDGKRRSKGASPPAPAAKDPLFDAFREITDTRHIFTYLASPFVADRNKPVSLYIAKRISEAVKVNYADPFFASLTSVYHYMLYQDFRDYMENVCGVTVTRDNIGHCFHAVYFPRFQNTEVYTRLWPKLGQHLPELDGAPGAEDDRD